jgi:hypothetical protein
MKLVFRAYVLYLPFYFIGPCPHRTRDYHIGSNLWKFYVVRTGFILDKQVFWVKVFRLFRLEWIFFGVESVDTGNRCRTSYLFAGPACMWDIVLFVCCIEFFQIMSLITLLIRLESSKQIRMHWVDFIMFWCTMEKLVNIEQISTQNSFESKLKIIGEFGCTFGILGKPLVSKVEWRWFFLDLRCLNNFCHWKFYQITKFAVERKISWRMSSHLGQLHNYTSIC